MLGECHAHIKLSYVEDSEIPGLIADGSAAKFIRECFQNYKNYGIDYVRDGGDKWGVSEMARDIAPEFGIEYRTPIFAIHKKGLYGDILGKCFETIEDYKVLVDEVEERNGDFIKIMASGILNYNKLGDVTPGPVGENELFSEMVYIAHERGFRVMTHANGVSQIKMMLEAGADTIEHGFYMDDECRELFLEKDAIWIPTIVTLDMFKEFADPVHNELDKIMEQQKDDIRKALKMGINIGPGSDSSLLASNHGKGLAGELKLLKEACEGDDELLKKLDETLEKSFKRIRETFRR